MAAAKEISMGVAKAVMRIHNFYCQTELGQNNSGANHYFRKEELYILVGQKRWAWHNCGVCTTVLVWLYLISYKIDISSLSEKLVWLYVNHIFDKCAAFFILMNLCKMSSATGVLGIKSNSGIDGAHSNFLFHWRILFLHCNVQKMFSKTEG